MMNKPFELYKYYLKEKERVLSEKDFTQKTYNNLKKVEKRLQIMGLLPINQKWKGL